jgi:Mg2+ and Co2+ transporter CorA
MGFEDYNGTVSASPGGNLSLSSLSVIPPTASGKRPDPRKGLREIVYQILPDSLMIALAVILLPVVVIPLVVKLPLPVDEFFGFVDYVILGIFIIEYFSKLFLAEDRWKHFINPWHLLDLLIVVVPVINFLPFVSSGLGASSPLLRLLRIVRLLAVGGRALDRRMQLAGPEAHSEELPEEPLFIQVMDGQLANNLENVPIDSLKKYLDSPSHTWINIGCFSDSDLDKISAVMGIPRIILESELVEDSYPRVDYFGQYSLIFTRAADVQLHTTGAARFSVERTGLLIICQGPNVITISRKKTDLFAEIIEQARKVHSPDDPVVVTILYTILKHILTKDRQVIRALEKELMVLESTPLKQRSDEFFEATFYLRKEVNQLVPSLLHLREILAIITANRLSLEGFNEKHEKIFDILTDEATYLHESSSNARDNLQSLVDLYINTTSFETNKVMRVIAVITSLGIIPAVMGLLGSNILGSPWNIALWQVFCILGVLMVAMGWVFYRMGWLKG